MTKLDLSFSHLVVKKAGKCSLRTFMKMISIMILMKCGIE
jgi:hypothetical protein